MSEPLAFFITFTCHGTWLHGSGRGSVDREHNRPGDPFLAPDPQREREETELCEPYLLDVERRRIALEAIRSIAAKKGWHLWAAHVRSNHVHVVVTASGEVERVMNDIKTAISRKLNNAYPAEHERRRWTRHGSTRYLWKEEQLQAAIGYVVDGQGDLMAYYDGRSEPRTQPSEPRTQRSEVSGEGSQA